MVSRLKPLTDIFVQIHDLSLEYAVQLAKVLSPAMSSRLALMIATIAISAHECASHI